MAAVVKALFFLFALSPLSLIAASDDDVNAMVSDLGKVRAIDKKLEDRLPLFYNHNLVVGYLISPSARMEREGVVALGGSLTSKVATYGANLQFFKRLELAGDYISLERNVKDWLHNRQEKRLHGKLQLLSPGDGFPYLPSISFGFDQNAFTGYRIDPYVVATKEWFAPSLELSLGWRGGKRAALFGGGSWALFRQREIPFFKNLSLVGDYDLSPPTRSRGEKRELHLGLSYLAWKALQVTFAGMGNGQKMALASLRYPLGSTSGIFSKTEDPPLYVNRDGGEEKNQELAQQFREAFSHQGLPILSLYYTFDKEGKRGLWMKVANQRYREIQAVRERIIALLAGLLPRDALWATVVIEADGVPAYSYTLAAADLPFLASAQRTAEEKEALVPMQEFTPMPNRDSSFLLLHRSKPISRFTFRPRFLTFFQGKEGKFAMDVGILGATEGYILDQFFYRVQAGLSLASTKPLPEKSKQLFSPKEFVEIRTDEARYYSSQRVTLEELYVQKGWKIGRSSYARLSGGLFEVAFGGGSVEYLCYPVGSAFALGLEAAVVWKRDYTLFGFMPQVQQLRHDQVEKVHFIGTQAFAALYSYYRPLQLDTKVSVGHFLAKDLGARAEVGRTFKSGFRFSLWYTLSAKPQQRTHLYHDQGFAFSIPLDIFMKKSSRATLGYAVATELRNNGVVSATGKPLYQTLCEERR